MSARPSTSSPDRASGATYLSVPTKNPVRVSRFPVVVGADHPRVLHARAIPRLAQEALDHRGVAREPRPQYLERTGPALGVLGAVHFGGASLADALEEAVAGDGSTGEVLAGHGNARN